MSAAGPLCAFVLALFFAGLYRVLTSPRRIDDCALALLGAVMFAAGLAIAAKGL